MATATRGQRLLIIALLTIALMAPPVVMAISGQFDLASAFVYGGIIAIGAAFYDLRLAVMLSGLAAVSGFVSVLLDPHPIAGAVFFGLLTGACALAAKRGLHSPVLMVPVFMSFVIAAPPQIEGLSALPTALLTGVVLLLGGLWATGSARMLLGHRRREYEGRGLSTRAAITYALLMAVVIGITAYVVLAYAKYHQGAWLLLTLILVLQPSPRDTFRTSLQRLGGTLIGGVVALALILVDVESTLALVIGGVLLFAALSARYVLERPYWQYIAVLTPAVILLNTPGLDPVRVTEDRVVYTMIATVVAIVIALAVKAVLVRKAPAGEST